MRLTLISRRNQMNTAQPIRNLEDLKNFKNYYKEIHPNARNQLLVILGLNTALRIRICLLCGGKMFITFLKTDGRSILRSLSRRRERPPASISIIIHACLQNYQAQLQKERKPIQPEKYLFPHSNKNEPISRVQAFRIIKKVAAYYNIPGVICCHSLRKTFGYHAWQQGVQPAMLVSIYNHSSYEVTKRYLGIEQDDRDKIFQEIIL